MVKQLIQRKRKREVRFSILVLEFIFLDLAGQKIWFLHSQQPGLNHFPQYTNSRIKKCSKAEKGELLNIHIGKKNL